MREPASRVKRDAPPQLAKARATFAESFGSPEEKSEHYRKLGRQAAARRVVLSGDEAEALIGAYDLLSRIAARHRRLTDPAPVKEEPAGDDPAGGEAAA